ncbi:MAG: UDP-N-acetylmuramate dehydrogenase, partial [Bacteroidota bacterium]|nr:UDP-N-acetylmuramate dehydrogenase [Bacteroidota bacterium]
MNTQKNFSLRPFNTFSIEAKAKYFARFDSVETLESLLEQRGRDPLPWLILGGGSNILFTRDFEGWVFHNSIRGIQVVHEDERHGYLKAGAGERWHELVLHAIHKNLGGIENLSLIPGLVGASPIQNIGAYGVEVKDVIHSLEAYSIAEKRVVTFTNNDCEFGYRDSIFKKRYKAEMVILNVTYRLDKTPRFRLSYGAIRDELEKMQVLQPTLKAVSDAIIRIRSSKLPDPAVLGNAGSFFKNPVLDENQFQRLQSHHPVDAGKIPFYKT